MDTLGDLLLGAAAARPEAPALITPTDHYTFAAVGARARVVAKALIGLDVAPGAPVGLLMANGFDCAAALFGIALSGATLVPINGRFRSVEIRGILEDAGVATVLTSDLVDDHVNYAALLGEAVADPAAIVLADRFDALAAGVSDAALDARRTAVRSRDTAMILFTSGTTSRPRGCRLSHEAVVRNWGSAVAHRLAVTAEDRVWMPTPFFHMAGIGVLTMAYAHGAAVLTDTHFDATRALDLIARERATVLYGTFPPISQAIVHHPDFAQADLSAVRASALVAPPEIMRATQAALAPAIVFSTFGMTETAGITNLTALDDPTELRMTTCGAPLPGIEVRVVDPETGAEQPAEVPGEITVRGPTLFDGYHGDPERTAEVVDGEGWLRTGDRGVVDADGHLRYLDRIKDMLRVGGENVGAAEIEAWLSTHPAVHLAQVVGLPDERLDEVPAAFVELRPGTTATEEELIAHCVGQIASFKVPRVVRIVTEWPMSATKIQKFRLREALLG
jgi:fatty-acyl-CoA synthase